MPKIIQNYQILSLESTNTDQSKILFIQFNSIRLNKWDQINFLY